jgi:hypothetical protein
VLTFVCSQIAIEITSSPDFFTVDDHEYIGVDYTYTYVMVTSQHSINASEPELVPENGTFFLSACDVYLIMSCLGTYTETYIVAVDPLYILQRTEYDCMDEAEFPLGRCELQTSSRHLHIIVDASFSLR